MLPVLREHHYVYCIPVTIGRNVWVGANVSILPGVTIGDNCVIGAGSVATSIPASSVAYGAPCEVVREIGDKDRSISTKIASSTCGSKLALLLLDLEAVAELAVAPVVDVVVFVDIANHLARAAIGDRVGGDVLGDQRVGANDRVVPDGAPGSTVTFAPIQTFSPMWTGNEYWAP